MALLFHHKGVSFHHHHAKETTNRIVESPMPRRANPLRSFMNKNCNARIEKKNISKLAPPKFRKIVSRLTFLNFRVRTSRLGDRLSIYSSTLQSSCKHQLLRDKVVKLVNTV